MTPVYRRAQTARRLDSDRSVGALLAQDASSPDKPYLYAATYSGGIARSYGTPGSNPPVAPGTSWTTAGLTASGFYPRALVINPANNQELWAGCWDSDGQGTFGGIWHCTDARTATTTATDWDHLSAATVPRSTVSDLLVLDGYVYAAYSLDGMYSQQIGATGPWMSLNVGAVNVNSEQMQIWTSIDGYVESASPLVHVIIAGSSSGQQKAASGNPYFTNIVKIRINYSTNPVTVSAVDLTGTATINTATMPPNGQGWWLNNPTGNYRNWLGGNKFVNPHILIDPNDPTHNTIFVTGASGFFYTTNASAGPGGISWQLAGTGVPLSAIAAIGVDPGNAMHVVLASADHPQTDLTDVTGWNAEDVTPVPMPSLFPNDPNYQGTESHAIAFDPTSNLYMGTNEKYGQNGYGTLWYRLAGSNFTWYDTQYNETVSSQLMIAPSAVKAPIGVFAGVNGNNTYLVVVSDGADIWRATAPTSKVQTGTTAWTWKQLSTGIGTGGSVNMNCPIVADSANPAVLYVFDRAQGIYRSTNYGLAGSWTQIWASSTSYPLNVSDGRSGWLAVNPSVGGELWVTASNGVFQLTSADTGTAVGNGIGYNNLTGSGTSNQFPYGAAGIAITSSEKVYTLAISGNASPLPALPDVQLLTTTTTGGLPWSPADVAGGSIASYVSWPTCVALAQSPYPSPAGQQILLIGSDSDWAVWGVPAQ